MIISKQDIQPTILPPKAFVNEDNFYNFKHAFLESSRLLRMASSYIKYDSALEKAIDEIRIRMNEIEIDD